MTCRHHPLSMAARHRHSLPSRLTQVDSMSGTPPAHTGLHGKLLALHTQGRTPGQLLGRTHPVDRTTVALASLACLGDLELGAVPGFSDIKPSTSGEANRLLSLDLSSLGDGSQLPGRAAVNNFWTRQYTHTHRQRTHRQEILVWAKIRLRHICRTAP
jgi:hypothetical protein